MHDAEQHHRVDREVRKMIRATRDTRGDIWHRARNVLIAAVGAVPEQFSEFCLVSFALSFFLVSFYVFQSSFHYLFRFPIMKNHPAELLKVDRISYKKLPGRIECMDDYTD